MFTSKDLEEMFRLDLPEDAEHPEINDSAYRAIKADKVRAVKAYRVVLRDIL
jgi:hypothetical protein